MNKKTKKSGIPRPTPWASCWCKGLGEVDQALSMSKVKQKISGCFRTEPKADIFFTIRSYLATMTKRKANLFDCMISVFKRQPVQPRFAD